MDSFKEILKAEIKKNNPRLDLTNFDEIYKVIVNSQYGLLKRKKCICYNKKCDKRMV